MKLGDFTIGLVLFSMAILWVSSMIGGGSDYGLSGGENLNTTYSKLSLLQEDIDILQNHTVGEATDLSWTSFGNLVFKGIPRAVKSMFDSVLIIKDISTDVENTGYVPSWFTNGIFVILSATFIFLIISFFRKWRAI